MVGDDPFVGAGDPKYAVMPGAEYAEAFVGDQDFAAVGPLRTVAFHGRRGRIGDSIVGVVGVADRVREIVRPRSGMLSHVQICGLPDVGRGFGDDAQHVVGQAGVACPVLPPG